MNLVAFLEYCHKNRNIPNTHIICFTGNNKNYPLLFFSHLISFLRKNRVIVETISTETTDSSLIKASLTTVSFNGPIIYWFNDLYLLPLKKQQEWIAYCASYTGPHTILLFCNEESCVASLRSQASIPVITIPHELSLQDITMIRFLLNDNPKKVSASVESGLNVQVMALDTLCLFNQYELVVGKNWNLFFKEWGPALMEQSGSLFLLSQYFFSKKPHLFFKRWAYTSDLYMPSFWPAFWADQLWRAYIYCDLMQQKKYPEAKKLQYKLPFSLINRDWSFLSLAELRQAHHYLSVMDYRLKNGASPVALELFFGKFFTHGFRNRLK